MGAQFNMGILAAAGISVTESPVQFVGSQSATSTGSNISFTLNSLTGGDAGVSPTIQERDIIVLWLSYGSTALSFTGFGTTTPGNPGFNGYLGPKAADDTYDCVSELYRMVARQDGAVSGSITGVAGVSIVAQFMVFRGGDPILEGTWDSAAATNGSPPNPPPITLTSDNTIVIACGAAAHVNGSEAFTISDLTDVVQVQVNSTVDLSSAMGLKRDAVGSFNPAAWSRAGATTTDSAVGAVGAIKKNILPTQDANLHKNLFLISGRAGGVGAPEDYSHNQWGLTTTGGVTSSATSLQGEPSIIFDGSGDYFRLPFLRYHNLNEGDFTLDLMVRFASAPVARTFLAKWLSGTNNRCWLFGYENGGLRFAVSTAGTSATVYDSAWSPSINTNYHLRACRSGTTLRLFIDGVFKDKFTSVPTTLFDANTSLYVGCVNEGAANNFHGNMNEIRLRMRAESTTDDNFTPPSAAWPRT